MLYYQYNRNSVVRPTVSVTLIRDYHQKRLPPTTAYLMLIVRQPLTTRLYGAHVETNNPTHIHRLFRDGSLDKQ